MPPGWYPDPFGAALRWWDGTTWTAHTVPFPSALVVAADPDADLAGEQRAGRWASVAVVASGFVTAAGVIAGVVTFRHFIHDLIDNLPVDCASDHVPHIDIAPIIAFQLFGLVGIATQILVMIWLYRAATLAGRAGLPARHDPI